MFPYIYIEKIKSICWFSVGIWNHGKLLNDCFVIASIVGLSQWVRSHNRRDFFRGLMLIFF